MWFADHETPEATPSCRRVAKSGGPYCDQGLELQHETGRHAKDLQLTEGGVMKEAVFSTEG